MEPQKNVFLPSQSTCSQVYQIENILYPAFAPKNKHIIFQNFISSSSLGRVATKQEMVMR